MEKILVTCTLQRVWDVATKTYVGQEKNGELIEFGSQSDGKQQVCVGIVLFEDGTFESVPLQFIKKQTTI